MSDGGRRAGAVLGLVASLAAVAVALVLNEGLAGRPGLAHPDSPRELGYYVVVVSLVGTALLIVWARPRNSVGWLLGLSGALGILCQTGSVYGTRSLVVDGSSLPLGRQVLALTAGLWLPALLIPATLLLARYPGGSLPSGRALLVDRVARVALLSLYAGYATMPEAVTDEVPLATNPFELPAVVRGPLLAGGALALFLVTLVVAGTAVRRLLRAGYPERQQLSLLVTTSVGSLAFVLLSPWEWLSVVGFTLLPISVAVGVLRYRLLGIEVVIRRTLLYGSLTGVVLLVLVATTSLVTAFAPDGPTATVLAAAVVAVVISPARDRLQRAVDTVVYGDRRDPWRALDRLGKEAVDADGLQAVVVALAESLRSPGARLTGSDGVVATFGAVEAGTRVPLVVAGQRVGDLLVAPRRGERALSAEDDQLLAALAPLLALVVRSTQLTQALQVEQERVVSATASERARLRRDLHDGLGPSLTGVGLGLEAIDSHTVPERQRTVVRRLRQEVAASLEEVRRIIDDLRPGALETADLLTLVRARAQHLSATTPVRVEVEAPAALHLAPEVEAAALRIVEEALTNVMRHACATVCTVRIDDEDGLRVEVSDDGVGFTGPRQGGVGLTSMRSRAAALGGSLDVTSDGGTTLVARLPS